MKNWKLKLLLLISLFLSTLINAGDLKKLTFEQAFMNKGEKLYSDMLDIQGWFDDDHYLYTDKKLYVVHYETGKKQLILNPEDYPDVEKNGFNLLKADNRTIGYERFIFLKDNDIYLFDRTNNLLSKLTETAAKEQNPTFSPDGESIAFTRDGNLFIYDIKNMKLKQLTLDGDNVILNGYASWIYYEEILGRQSRYKAFWWSPDSKKIAFMRFDQTKVPIYDITIFKGDYNHIEKQFYPKPGYPNPDVKIGIADVESGVINWVDFVDKTEHYLAFPVWEKNGDHLYFQWMSRAQTDLKILSCDKNGGDVSVKYKETQKEWIDFPDSDSLLYTEKGELFLISSQDGWYNLFHVQKDGKFSKLTDGEWIVRKISAYDSRRKKIYFVASKEDSTDFGLYSVSLKNKDIKRISADKGTHSYIFSPDSEKFIETASSLSTAKTIVIRNADGKFIKSLYKVDTSVASQYALGKYELFRIPISDGYKLPAIWLLPPDFSPEKKYPVIMNIYGGPAAPSVFNSFRQSLGEQFYAQQDIIQLWVDHRGSGHFGKKGEVLMYRRLGYWEMKDFTDVAKYLQNLAFIDGKKIGISGGSYGGYVSALAVCYAPDYFQFADADASVTDWHYYDSVYTEHFMDTPEENPEGYKNGSILTYADNYKGGLRISHGTADDNVHMQNTIVLINELENKGKKFEFMLYPEERHGYRGAKRAQNNKESLNFWLRSFFGKEYTESGN